MNNTTTRFADDDDVALVASTEGNLQQLVNEVSKASESFDVSLNVREAGVMINGATHLP